MIRVPSSLSNAVQVFATTKIYSACRQGRGRTECLIECVNAKDLKFWSLLHDVALAIFSLYIYPVLSGDR